MIHADESYSNGILPVHITNLSSPQKVCPIGKLFGLLCDLLATTRSSILHERHNFMGEYNL